jgi:3-oxoacyl-[acyl-carrier protein] reductase
MIKSKVFLITGGARGIGLSIFKYAINAGAMAVICSRNTDEINKAIKEVDPSGERSLGLKVDVSNILQVESLIAKAIKKFGKIDVLVNNAGIYGPIGLLETNYIDDWQQTMNINLMGTVNCCRAVLPFMKKNKSGKIINLAGAGVGGTKPLARFTAYFTSKMAVAGFTEALAKEVLTDNIQVNCIAPGGVNTYFTEWLLINGEEKAGSEMYNQALKQKESGGDDPDLAAKMVMFLSSTKSDHITGKIISAKWDLIEVMSNKNNIKNNLYNLRRIDNSFFYEKK